MYHDLYLGRKALVEKENMSLDLTKSDLCPSFVEDLTEKGMGLRVANSYTGNHLKDDFTPLETIRRFLEMSFRNFMYNETDKDLSFLPKEPSPNFGTGSPSISINTKPPIGDAKPMGASSSRVTRAKTTSLKDASLMLTIFDDDEGPPNVLELQNANACHLKISTITPPTWKNHIDNHLDELLKVIKQISGECDVIKESERANDEECEALKAKCEAAMTNFDNNLVVVPLREKISTLSSEAKEHKAKLDWMMLEKAKKARLEAVEASLRQEVDDVKRDRMELVSKVVPYIAMELVVEMKEPFDMMKVKGYRPPYKKAHTKAGNDLAIATFPFLFEVVADPSMSIEALLSKKPSILQ
ncbi:hypothetical protein Tco_1466358 [Tanacetum coccineum]